jgi:2-alkenal reductase
MPPKYRLSFGGIMKQGSFKQFLAVAFMALILSGCAGILQSDASVQPVSSVVETAPAVAEPSIVIPTQPAIVAAPSVTAPSVVDPLTSLLAQQQAFIDVYEAANPAVVNINVGNGQGSGFVYNEDGYIVTNNHVVEGARRIVVTLSDDTQLPARLIGTDPDSDLAVIKVDAGLGELTTVPLADSEALKVGQIVIAIGNPFGLENSMTTGIVSGLGRLLPSAEAPNGSSYNIPDIIQTDAAINPGNSGGPLLDLFGNVIGVNSAIASPVRGSSGVGYAIPANIVDVVVPQLIQSGQVAHPWLGIAGGSLTADIAEALGLDRDQRGVLVNSVTANGPAAIAGLRGSTGQGGDIIMGIEDLTVEEFDDLLGYIVQHTQVGQTVTLRIMRDGRSQNVPLTLQARPSAG